ncbi:MAG: hypothetical protein DWQ56_21895 [Microcystis aeruginosa DA14]|uniref:Tetrapyrrole methylase domain-containing protein n=1 Tax=Microcystis aeruginosa DA14 TaxID=1987506 RepID=A0A3E0M1E9_MICAE|nr:MAG: hypothetical protein DWQ56_21895 [Microcystis aeruginosa DA14]
MTTIKKHDKMGSLVVVGTGLHVGQLTLEARANIEVADHVVYLVTDSVTEEFILSLNSNAESLRQYYADDKNRLISYEEMIAHITNLVHNNLEVCAVFYGHPGIFVYPSHESIQRLRQEGYKARMLPGISAEDCLYADLGIDPGRQGSQSFEATDFILRDRIFDPHSYLILWQIGSLGSYTFSSTGIYDRRGVDILLNKLLSNYPSNHEVILYKASVIPLCSHEVQRFALCDLVTAKTNGSMTLIIPPCANKENVPEIEAILEIPDILRRHSQPV